MSSRLASHSTIAKGRLASLDVAAAEAAPGVVLVMTHKNAPRMKATPVFFSKPKAAVGDDQSNRTARRDAGVERRRTHHPRRLAGRVSYGLVNGRDLWPQERSRARHLPLRGDGFDSKNLWQHHIFAAAASKLAGRPVRLMLTREGAYRVVGGPVVGKYTCLLGLLGWYRVSPRNSSTRSHRRSRRFRSLRGSFSIRRFSSGNYAFGCFTRSSMFSILPTVCYHT